MANDRQEGDFALADIDEEIHALCDALMHPAVRPMKTHDRRVCPSCGSELSGTLAFCRERRERGSVMVY